MITSAVVTSSLPPLPLVFSVVEAGCGVVLEAVEPLGLVVEEKMVVEEGEVVEVDSGELVVVDLITESFSSNTDCFLDCSSDFF